MKKLLRGTAVRRYLHHIFEFLGTTIIIVTGFLGTILSEKYETQQMMLGCIMGIGLLKIGELVKKYS